MPNQRLTLIILLACVLPVLQSCSVCSKCTNCSPDVLADSYLDGIDALLQAKI